MKGYVEGDARAGRVQDMLYFLPHKVSSYMVMSLILFKVETVATCFIYFSLSMINFTLH